MTGGPPIPKPPKREKKRPKPLKRSRIETKYRKPIPRQGQSAHAKAERAADREWSKAVLAKGDCSARGFWNLPSLGFEVSVWAHTRCWEPIDPAHIMSRTFPATRNDPDNGMPLCRVAHDFFTAHPKAWEEFCRLKIGNDSYEALYRRAHHSIRALEGPVRIEMRYIDTVHSPAERNELAAIRLFLKIPDDQSVMGFLRERWPR